jgi:hypothetical protein
LLFAAASEVVTVPASIVVEESTVVAPSGDVVTVTFDGDVQLEHRTRMLQLPSGGLQMAPATPDRDERARRA